LSFNEFLKLKNIQIDKNKIILYNKDLLPLFFDYLKKGGFPEIINEENEEKIKNYVKNSIIDKIIYQDLPLEFKLKDQNLLRTIIELIASNPGMMINFETLSKELQRNRNTLMDYLYYLEYALLIRMLANYRGKFSISSRKLKKAYLTNTAISYAFTDQLNDKLLEKIFENSAVIVTDSKNYYRNKIEVDIILKIKNKIIPIEVKHGKVEEDSLIYFLNEFSIKKGFILTNEIFDKNIIDNKEIDYIPLWAFSLFKNDYLKDYYSERN
jgi:predicted AAA+ superfamily ATPase